jgi:hypothetical protein
MPFVPTVVHAPTVMEKGEQSNNVDVGSCASRQKQPVYLDTTPMSGPMNRVFSGMKLARNNLFKPVKVDLHALKSSLQFDATISFLRETVIWHSGRSQVKLVVPDSWMDSRRFYFWNGGKSILHTRAFANLVG